MEADYLPATKHAKKTVGFFGLIIKLRFILIYDMDSRSHYSSFSKKLWQGRFNMKTPSRMDSDNVVTIYGPRDDDQLKRYQERTQK